MQGYPTIKMFPAGKKDASDAVEYDGGRNSDAIVAWALDKLAENVQPPDVYEVCVHNIVVHNNIDMYDKRRQMPLCSFIRERCFLAITLFLNFCVASVGCSG